jgi:hypothetical protein
MKKRIPFFSVLGESGTYLNIVYLLIAFPLSAVYFSLVLAGLSLSVGLLIVVVGIFIFVGTLLMIRGFRWLDIQLSNVFLGRKIPAKPRENTAQGFIPFLKQLFGQSSTWKLFVYYLLVKFPMDAILWSISVAFLAMTIDLLLAPALAPHPWFDNDGLNRWLVRFFDDVYVLPLLGIIWGMITLHVLRGLSWVAGTINEVFLGD